MKAEDLYGKLTLAMNAVIVDNSNMTQKAQKAVLAVLEESKDAFLAVEAAQPANTNVYEEGEDQPKFENALSVFKHLVKVMDTEQVTHLGMEGVTREYTLSSFQHRKSTE